MKARPILIALATLTAAIGAIAAVLHFQPRMRREVLVSVPHKALAETNETAIAAVLEHAMSTSVPGAVGLRSESTPRGVTIAIAFEEPAFDQFARHLGVVQAAVLGQLRALPADVGAPQVAWRPSAETIWVIAPKDISPELADVPHVDAVTVCGAPRPDRVRVAFDRAKLQSFGVELSDIPLAALPSDPEKLSAFPIGAVKLSDLATVTREPHLPPCAAWSGDAKPVVVHAVHAAPSITAEGRARLDQLSARAAGAVLASGDTAQARFIVMGGNTQESRRRVAADLAGRAKAQGLPIRAAFVNVDGVGSLLFERPVDKLVVQSIVRTALADGWGGFRVIDPSDGVRLDVVVRGTGAELERRAAEIAKRIDAVEGVGARLATTPPLEPTTLYDFDEEIVKREHLNLDSLRAIAAAWQGADIDAPIVFAVPPMTELYVHGAPVTALLQIRNVMLRPRRVRVDSTPALELAWEHGDAAVLARVRQALGESPDVSARAGAGFSDLSSF